MILAGLPLRLLRLDSTLIPRRATLSFFRDGVKCTTVDDWA